MSVTEAGRQAQLAEASHAAGNAISSGIAIVAVGHLAADLCSGIWPVYKTLAEIDLTEAGIIATAGAIAGNLLQPVFGILADRGWRKLLVALGVLLSGVAAFLPYFSGFWPLLLLVVGSAVGSAAFHPAGAGAAGALSAARTGLSMAIFFTGGYVGYALSQVAFTTAYRVGHGATGILFLVPLATALAVIRLSPDILDRPKAQQAQQWSRAILQKLLPLFAVQVFSSTASVALIFLLPDLLTARSAPQWLVQGVGHAGLVLGGALSLLPAGSLSDRFGARRVLFFANLMAGVTLLWLVFATIDPFATLILLVAFGLFLGVNSVVLVAEGSRLYPGRSSLVSSLLMGLPWAFSSLSPTIAGVLADPARGGNPASALGWMALAIPFALIACPMMPARNRVANQ